MIVDVDKNVMTLKSYCTEKFSQLELTFLNELNNVRETIGRLQVDVSKEFSNIKLQFGQEVLRLDQQQVRIIDKVQTLSHQVKSYGVELMSMRNEFERGAMKVENFLGKVELVHQKQQVAIQAISKEIDLNLQQMAVHKREFANEVGSSKLQLEQISNSQYLALKDMAFERIGINALRDEYQQRATLEQTKMQSLIAEKRNIEQRIQENISRGQQVDELKHRLYMTQENLQYTSNRANLMQQEAAVVRRHSM